MKIVGWREFIELSEVPPIPEELGKYDKSITQFQKDCLRKEGIGYTGIDSSLKAERVLCIARRRRRNKLATPGQMQMLRKLGVRDVKNKTFAEAKELIGNSFHW